MNFLKINGNQISIKEFENSIGLKVDVAESFCGRSDLTKTPFNIDFINLVQVDFSECSNLVEINDGLRGGKVSFSRCRSLVKIGKNIEVSSVSFDHCINLKEIPEDFKASMISVTGTQISFLNLKYAKETDLAIICDGKVFHSVTDFNLFKNSKRIVSDLKDGKI